MISNEHLELCSLFFNVYIVLFNPSLTVESTVFNGNDTEPSTTENSGASGSSTNTVIFNPQTKDRPSSNQTLSPMHTWNPVLDRLTGYNKRNESYYKVRTIRKCFCDQCVNVTYAQAAHDSWNASMLAGNNSFNVNGTTTVNINSAEPILIEDEYGSRVVPPQTTR